MSAIELQRTETTEQQSIALPMVAWATALVGLWPVALVIAYLERGKAGPEVATTYRYLIRTVWIGAMYFLVSLALCAVLVGAVLLTVVALWWCARCIKAMLALHRGEPLRNIGTWFV